MQSTRRSVSGFARFPLRMVKNSARKVLQGGGGRMVITRGAPCAGKLPSNDLLSVSHVLPRCSPDNIPEIAALEHQCGMNQNGERHVDQDGGG